MLKKSIPDLKGMQAIIGRSNIVGKPMAQLFRRVVLLHRSFKTRTLKKSQNKLILWSPRLKPLMVKKDWIKRVVIDVGINRVDHPDKPGKTKLVGDVDYDDVFEVVSAITPVPGGVGPMTIACLLKNTVDAAFRQQA